MTMRRATIGLCALILVAGSTSCGDTNDDSNTDNSTAPSTAAIQPALDRLVADGDVVGIAASISEDDVVQATAGLGDLSNREPYPRDAHIRIASLTKSFVAALVLQLADDNKVDLEAPIERYLPGMLRGQGIDARAITVRQILQHRSGLPEYAGEPEIRRAYSGADTRTYTPRELVDLALRHPPQSAPGKRMIYTNTNYVVAGMLVEKIVGESLDAVLKDRITTPLGLRDTYLPRPGDTSIANPAPTGYQLVDGKPTDVTALEPSVLWASGGMISTGADLNRFFSALLGGDVLSPRGLRQMKTTVPMQGVPGVRYGLGLMRFELACGTVAWGNAGDTQGFEAMVGTTADGERTASIEMNQVPTEIPGPILFEQLLSKTLC